jgi:hypothetical protein
MGHHFVGFEFMARAEHRPGGMLSFFAGDVLLAIGFFLLEQGSRLRPQVLSGVFYFSTISSF